MSEKPPCQSWKTNQKPRKNIAEIGTGRKPKSSVTTRAWGRSTKYAPSTPAIAPLAPTVGMLAAAVPAKCSVTPRLRERGGEAGREVEDEEADAAHHVLDVVAEDPEEEHVPEQVQPARVQEHAGETRPRATAGGRVAGPTHGPLTAHGIERVVVDPRPR